MISGDLYFYTPDAANPGGFIKNFVVLATATNNDKCLADIADTEAYRAAGLEVPVDGAFYVIDPVTGKTAPGVVAGVPTAVITIIKLIKLWMVPLFS